MNHPGIIITLLACIAMSGWTQTDFTQTELLLDETETVLLTSDDPVTLINLEETINTILASDIEELYPRARILSYLREERLHGLYTASSESETPYSVPYYSRKHIRKGAMISSAVGIAGLLGYVSLNIWADSVYYRDYADLGADQTDKAAEAMNTWRFLDNGSYISLGIGMLGFSLTPLFLSFTESDPARLNPESNEEIRGVSTMQKYEALTQKRETLAAEYQEVTAKKGRRKILTFTSLGLTLASGVATGVCAYLGREAHIDYAAASGSEKAGEYKDYANFLDVLTISCASATGLFGFSTILMGGTGPSEEDIRREIAAIDYQLENWVRF
ncbi:MAG: hypothetical protein JXB03_09645 [Spirochaetales bacterium]|nr:hypothetical protein [Spirochaetales bacterium]